MKWESPSNAAGDNWHVFSRNGCDCIRKEYSNVTYDDDRFGDGDGSHSRPDG